LREGIAAHHRQNTAGERVDRDNAAIDVRHLAQAVMVLFNGLIGRILGVSASTRTTSPKELAARRGARNAGQAGERSRRRVRGSRAQASA
jgi:hypothetical protein